MNHALQARRLVELYDRRTRAFFGGPPFTEEVERELQNTSLYQKGLMNPRARTCLGFCEIRSGEVLGYEATTIMQHASPTSYERQYLHLSSPLVYVQLKKIVVHPRMQGKGIAERLLKKSLSIADTLKKDWVVDVNAQNERMLAFLDKHGIGPRLIWYTRSGTEMVRLGIILEQ